MRICEIILALIAVLGGVFGILLTLSSLSGAPGVAICCLAAALSCWYGAVRLAGTMIMIGGAIPLATVADGGTVAWGFVYLAVGGGVVGIGYIIAGFVLRRVRNRVPTQRSSDPPSSVDLAVV